ncbi:MAG TPA: D-alanyl-D-alanine carboxypeptidase, partial [Lapillicoccus sp.]|nr:D-alanyl-D-alanine carboxypeptidase [Lapillicoccus sp.]
MRRAPTLRLLASAVVVGALGVAGALAPMAGAAAAVAPLSPTDQRTHDRLATRSADDRLGPDLAGLVTDLESGQTVWSSHRAERQLPASNVKLLTAVNALEAYGPDHRFRTTVVSGATSHRVVLVGSGDPSLSRADLRRLADRTVAAATAAGTGWVRVDVDDSLFPKPRPARGWRSEYLISEVSPVRALVVDQHRRWDTSLDAGRVFADVLERKGLDVRRSVTRVTAPVGAATIGEVLGDDLAATVADMLRTSDNDVAEGLHRLVALRTGFRPTWPGA